MAAAPPRDPAGDHRRWRCEATLPIPEHGLDLLVYGNLTDERGVVTSTPPLAIPAAALADAAMTPLTMNAFPDGDFSAEHVQRLRGTAMLSGVPDENVFHGEVPGSIHVPPPADGRPGEIAYALAHVPLHAHRLRLQLRAERPVAVEIAVDALAPDHWGKPLVDRLGTSRFPRIPRSGDSVSTLAPAGLDNHRIRVGQLESGGAGMRPQGPAFRGLPTHRPLRRERPRVGRQRGVRPALASLGPHPLAVGRGRLASPSGNPLNRRWLPRSRLS